MFPGTNNLLGDFLYRLILSVGDHFKLQQ